MPRYPSTEKMVATYNRLSDSQLRFLAAPPGKAPRVSIAELREMMEAGLVAVTPLARRVLDEGQEELNRRAEAALAEARAQRVREQEAEAKSARSPAATPQAVPQLARRLRPKGTRSKQAVGRLRARRERG